MLALISVILTSSYHIIHKLNRVSPSFYLTCWLALSLSIRALHLVHFHNFLFVGFSSFHFVRCNASTHISELVMHKKNTKEENLICQLLRPTMPGLFCSPCVLYLKPNNVNIFAWHFANEFSLLFSPMNFLYHFVHSYDITGMFSLSFDNIFFALKLFPWAWEFRFVVACVLCVLETCNWIAGNYRLSV